VRLILLTLILKISCLICLAEDYSNPPWRATVTAIDKHLSDTDKTALKYYLDDRNDSWAYGKGAEINQNLMSWLTLEYKLRDKTKLIDFFKEHSITSDILIRSFLIEAWFAHSTQRDFKPEKRLSSYAMTQKIFKDSHHKSP
jgi:hypothetical protein